jgi:hypothetical protein
LFPPKNLLEVFSTKSKERLGGEENDMKREIALLSAIAALSFAGLAKATTLYSNGFEAGDPGTADFYDSTTNVQGQNITIVANGGGALGLTAASGTHYAEITNTNDTYQAPGYGESVYTDYGYGRNGDTSGPGVATGGAFYESTAYYINTDWAAAANAGVPAFWIDSTPDSDPSYSNESNFQVFAPGTGTVGVGFIGTAPTVNITSSGWYTFKTTFEDGAGGDVLDVLSVLNSTGTVLGSYNYQSTMPYADLDGTNYGDWTTVWQNGFGATNPGGLNGAANTLGIDDVEVGTLATVPLPASAWSGIALLGGLATFGGFKRLRKQTA